MDPMEGRVFWAMPPEVRSWLERVASLPSMGTTERCNAALVLTMDRLASAVEALAVRKVA